MKRILYLIIAAAAVSVSCQKTDGPDTLAIPGNLTSSLDGTTVTLDWDAVPDAVSYIVHWNIEGEHAYSKSDLLSEPGYKVERLKTGTTYEFKVRAASNTASSRFTDVLKVVVPQPEEPDMPTAPAPVVSNIRPGLGWVNFTMGAYDGECTYEAYDGNAIIEGAVFEKISGGEDGSMEYSLGGLELDKNYNGLKIKRIAEGYLDSEFAALDAFRTGNIISLTRNPSARHIAFEWDDVAAGANWTFETVDPLTRTYKVEIATDAEFSNVVRSLYTVNNWYRDSNAKTGTYSANNWVGQCGVPEKAAKPYANANTNLCVGQLEPGTTYWVRIRNAAGESVDDVAGEDGGKIDMNAATGRSAWSAAISVATQAAHTPAAGELLYQPFDDHAFSCDQINCAAGASPSGVGISASSTDSEYSYPWTGEWGAFLPHTGARYDNLGASVTGPFEGNGETKLENLEVYRMNARIPSMNGWFCSKACYPQQGALKIGGSAGQKNYIITPAFTEVADGTEITISCSAGATHAASTPARLHICIYRAATHQIELVNTVALPASAYVLNPDGSGNGFHNIVEMKTYSADAVLNKGDYVMFEAETIKTPATNRLMIDNILIKKK